MSSPVPCTIVLPKHLMACEQAVICLAHSSILALENPLFGKEICLSKGTGHRSHFQLYTSLFLDAAYINSSA